MSVPKQSSKRALEETKLDGRPTKRHKKNASYYDIFGEDSHVEISLKREQMNKRRHRKFLHGQDFQTVILWMLGEVMSPKWMFIKHRPLIEKVVVVQIEDLSAELIHSIRSADTSTPTDHSTKRKEASSSGVLSLHSAVTAAAAAVANVNGLRCESVAKPQSPPFAFFRKDHYCPLQLDIPKFEHKNKTKYPSFKKLTVVPVDRIKGLTNNKNLPFGRKRKRRRNSIPQQRPGNVSRNGANGGNAIQMDGEYKFPPEQFLCTALEMKTNRYPSPNDPEHLNYTAFFQLPRSGDTDHSTHSRTVAHGAGGGAGRLRHRVQGHGEENVSDSDVSGGTGSTADEDSTTGDSSSDPSVGCTKCIEKLVALDCEMVTTTKGTELARISITSERGECIYDELVKPSNRIVDYCTKYSGITASMLEPVTKTVADVHSEISAFMDASTIIVGHGLENDLLAMEMIHSRCIDTALRYPASSPNHKNKLRYLAQKYLDRKIQQSEHGHNSHEDALAALDLVKLKLRNGPEFGLPERSNFVSLFTVLRHFECKSSLIGPTDLFARISTTTPVECLPTPSDKKTVKKATSMIRDEENGVKLVWVYLKEHQSLGGNLRKIHDAAPDNSVVVLVSGRKNLSRLHQLSDLKAKAIENGDVAKAEEAAEKIRNENNNASQYPFWIYAKGQEAR